MATVAPDALRGIYRAIRASGQYRSMREGGIVGDVRHQRRGGYHISRQDQSSSSNYSIQAPADKRGPANLAAGIDITMNAADMRKMTQRLMEACKRNRVDSKVEPRIEPVREFFGTLNGRSVTGYNRYPSANRGVGLTSSDSSHLWHVHISVFRDYCDDAAKMKALTDILLGKPLRPPTPPKPPPPPIPKPDEGDDVITDADIDKIALRTRDRVLADDVIPSWHDGGPWRLREMLPDIRAEIEELKAQLAEIQAALPKPPAPETAEASQSELDPYAPPHEADPQE